MAKLVTLRAVLAAGVALSFAAEASAQSASQMPAPAARVIRVPQGYGQTSAAPRGQDPIDTLLHSQETAVPPSYAAPQATPQVVLRGDQIALIRQTLDQAGSHGLDPAAYAPAGMDAGLASSSPGSRQLALRQLSDGLMAYAHDVHAGRLPAGQFINDWGLRPLPYDPRPSFIAAVQADRLQDWIAALPPPYAGYDSLRQGLQIYRSIVANGGWRTLPQGAKLEAGTSDGRVALLRARLAAEDGAVQADASPVFDEALQQAVARAQKRYGLKPDGVVGPALLTALNIPAQQRLEQITANLERWRWLPAQLPADRIQVNIAAAVLTVFHEDTPTLSMRAVTGRPGDETPMLESQVQSIVINPPWNVPSSIATKELWPKERANPGYFAKHSISVIQIPGGGTRLQQKAGDASALGRLKFDFPNTYGVYLHDTPSHGTFATYGRMVSHGCVRLERPMDLAKTVLAADPRWQGDAIDQAIADGDTLRAPLPSPIAVFLLYWTAYLAPDGSVNFRDDPYSWDRELARRLAMTNGPAATPASVAAL